MALRRGCSSRLAQAPDLPYGEVMEKTAAQGDRNPLLQLQAEGQSVWYDNIDRSQLDSGQVRTATGFTLNGEIQ